VGPDRGIKCDGEDGHKADSDMFCVGSVGEPDVGYRSGLPVLGRNFRESRLRGADAAGLGTTDICRETATSRAPTSFVR
jgi:hypothetical protein